MNKLALIIVLIVGFSKSLLCQEVGYDLTIREIVSIASNNKGVYDTLVFSTEPQKTKFRLLRFDVTGIKIFWNPDFSEWSNEDKSEYSGVHGCLLEKNDRFIFISTIDSESKAPTEITIYDNSIDEIVLKLYYVGGLNYAYSLYEYTEDGEVLEQLVLRGFDFSTEKLVEIDFFRLAQISVDRGLSDNIGAYKKSHRKAVFHRGCLY